MTIVQSVFFVYFVNYCLGYQKRITSKLVLCGILLSCDAYFIPNIFGNVSLNVFITHVLAMLVVSLFFYKKITEALIAFNLVYSVLLVWITIVGNILSGILEKIIIKDHMEILNIIFLYILQVILCIFVIKKVKTFERVYKILLSQNLSIYHIALAGLIPDFLVSFYSITYKKESSFLVYSLIILLVMFMITSIISFIKIKERADKIFKLNRALEIKNSELRKIKNSYETQMLALYQLCMMGQYNDLSNLLKSIINEASNANLSENNKNQQSMLLYATRHIHSTDIKIIVNDNTNLALLAISEIEIYRIVVNIVNNAVKAMKDKGTLTISSYYKYENIIIEIENDGEMIPNEHIDKIFQSGFTTKKDNDKNHGYGLSIVKELIESYDGKIFVESNEIITKFTIDFPIEKFENLAVSN
jgi:hypothetical protein